MADEREVLVEVKNLEVTYGSGRKAYKAVKNANFTIYKGETFGLVGESGSGKTTIGRAIMRILPTSGGEVFYKGQKINGKISHALEEVGLLPEFSSRFPHEFSGGQRQRIGIARSLIMQPEFIVADEPISALDVSIRAQVLNLLNELKKKRNLTYLFIAHDLSVVRFISDRIAVIHKGRIVELAEAEELFRHPLHPYTRALLSAVPNPNPYLERSKKLLVYDPSVHDYSVDKPEWCEILPDHFVYGNAPELDGYRKELGL